MINKLKKNSQKFFSMVKYIYNRVMEFIKKKKKNKKKIIR